MNCFIILYYIFIFWPGNYFATYDFPRQLNTSLFYPLIIIFRWLLFITEINYLSSTYRSIVFTRARKPHSCCSHRRTRRFIIAFVLHSDIIHFVSNYNLVYKILFLKKIVLYLLWISTKWKSRVGMTYPQLKGHWSWLKLLPVLAWWHRQLQDDVYKQEVLN